MAAYSFTTLNDPATGTLEAGAYGINDQGQIIGSVRTDDGTNIRTSGFLFNGSTYTIIKDPLAPNWTYTVGLNNAGHIVGAYIDAGLHLHGFLDINGTFTNIDDPLGPGGSAAAGINSSDQIVGIYQASTGITYGFLYTAGTYTTIDDPLAAGGQGTFAKGINDSGKIVGLYFDTAGMTHGFLFNGSTYTTIDNPLGVGGTGLTGIDNAGNIVGTYVDGAGLNHGFVYSNGTFTTLTDPLASTNPVSFGNFFGFNENGTGGFGISETTGKVVGAYYTSDGVAHAYFASSGPATVTAQAIQNDYLGIIRSILALSDATSVVNSISAGTQTETAYVNGLLAQATDTTIPAVAVEASMYGATGTSAEITKLTNIYLPPQVANAVLNGFDKLVYASEALGLVFAFGNETGDTSFATNFGPSNPNMPGTTAGDAAFATAAVTTIFGSAATTNLNNVMKQFVTNWEAFYTTYGLPGNATPTATEIELAARGAAWGDMTGIALANNLGPLYSETTNFLMDAAQGTAVYGASLVGQPAHQPFQA